MSVSSGGLFCFSVVFSFSARLENFYVYFNVTDEEKVGIYVKDTPSILPSSKKHLWGRMFELGSTSVKVCDNDLVILTVRL